MKKPNYIEIRLPGRKGTFSSAKTKYFKRLVGKVLNVNFARYRERKLFKYKVIASKYWNPNVYRRKTDKTYLSLLLEIIVPKEDLNKEP